MSGPPRRTDSFHRAHMAPELRNGDVWQINYKDKEVRVKYADGIVTYSWDELEYCHSDKFDGIYYPDR